MDDDLEDIKNRLAKVEADNSWSKDIIKMFFTERQTSSPRRPALPKGKRSWKSILLWGIFIVWQVISSLFRGIPEEFMDMFL